MRHDVGACEGSIEMSLIACGQVQLAMDRAGEGAPLILVHGSWADRSSWEPVFTLLAKRFDTIRYDRRGYGESQRPGVGMSAHVSDLLALVRTLGLNHVLLVGSSYGGIVASAAALAAPESIADVIIHEPPLFDLLDIHAKNRAVSVNTRAALGAVMDAARAHDRTRAAQTYVENMSGAPGAWPFLPPAVQEGFVNNADAFLSDCNPDELVSLGIPELRRLGERLAVTRGARSATFLKVIAALLCTELQDARSHLFPNAGHVPHQTCPDEFTGAILNLTALRRS
jgi:pimeloyl-ACP methyl ester carboxylesterase